jgi:hypothetical protein
MSANYDLIEVLYDPLIVRIRSILDIVRQFIIDRKLIATGGIAIDQALRLKGDFIYGDDDINSLLPDYDFYTPNHIKDAYELSKILYDKGFSMDEQGNDKYRIDAIKALHVSTIRVRIYSKSVADLTYISPEVFDKMPYITVNGMKIIHPQWQSINIHLSLSYPLQNAPKENIFNRMVKDMSRGDRLIKYYPLENTYTQTKSFNVKWTSNFLSINADTNLKPVLFGFSAYAAVYKFYKQILPDQLNNIIPANMTGELFTSPIDHLEYIITDPDYIEQCRGDSTYDEYEPFIDYMMGYFMSQSGEFAYILDHNIINICHYTIDGLQLYVPSIHMLLLYFLFKYNSATIGVVNTDKDITMYGTYYMSCITMYNNICNYLNTFSMELSEYELGSKTAPKTVRQADNIILNSPFMLSKMLYGSKNFSESNELLLHDLRRIRHMIMRKDFDEPLDPLPARYFGPTAAALDVPEFDYKSSKYFNKVGQKIEKH